MPDVRDPASRLSDLVDKFAPSLRRKFLEAMFVAKSKLTIEVLIGYLEAGRVDEATAVVERVIAAFAEVVHAAMVASGRATAEVIARAIELSFSFDSTSLRVVAAARAAKFDLIREFADEQRKAVRAAIFEGVTTGVNPRDQARLIRGSIGLTERQQQAVGNYRRLLESGSSESLQRQLRDRRFDSTVARAIDSGNVLDGTQIDRMVDRYRERYLAYRAEVIARTEALRAVHVGNDQTFQQAFDRGDLNPDEVVREWYTSRDERVRLIHRTMHEQERAVGEAFMDGEGNQLMYPGDASAPADTTVQCFLPGTMIGRSGIRAAMKRWYSGQVVDITTWSGGRISVTANHPILTLRGWVRADSITESDHLIERNREKDFRCGLDQYVTNRQSEVQDIFDSFSQIRPIVRIGSIHVNLHGERPNHDVYVVGSDRKLLDRIESLQVFGDLVFKLADVLPSYLSRQGVSSEFFWWPLTSTHSIMSGRSQRLSFAARHPAHANLVSFASSSWLETKIAKARHNHWSGSANAMSHFQDRESGLIHGRNFGKQIPPLDFVMQNRWSDEDRFGWIARSDREVSQARDDDVMTRPKKTRHLHDGDLFGIESGDSFQQRLPGLCPVRLSSLVRRHYEGLVFNVETETGIIESNGTVISRNCRCSVATRINIALLPGESIDVVTHQPAETLAG